MLIEHGDFDLLLSFTSLIRCCTIGIEHINRNDKEIQTNFFGMIMIYRNHPFYSSRKRPQPSIGSILLRLQ